MRLGKLAAWGGVAGPLLFTAAWVVSSLRQAGHPAAGVQLGGLAAEDARDPQIMIAAFVMLGACSIGFGAALRTVAGHRRGAVAGHGGRGGGRYICQSVLVAALQLLSLSLPITYCRASRDH